MSTSLKAAASRRSFMKALLAAGTGAAVMPAMAANSPATKTSENTKSYDYDVVVLGAGTAGLVTAITAAEAGAKVAVLEKCDRPDGNSIYAVGGVAAWGTKFQASKGVKDSRQDFYDTMMKVSLNRADPDLTATYVDHISEDVDWLSEKMGIVFKGIMVSPWPLLSRCMLIDGNGITGGSRLVQTLMARARERKVDFFFEHKAIELIPTDAGGVAGVIAQTPQHRVRFLSKGGVAVCTGGFSANQEYTSLYIGDWAGRLALRGSHSVTGENITLTRPFFAKFVNMSQFHAGPIDARTHINPQAVLNSGYGLIVNNQGVRFLDEAHTYVEKAKECAQLTPENKGWQILDSRWEPMKGFLANAKKLNAFVATANSIEELAKSANLPVEALVRSVTEFNSAVQNNQTSKLTPACTLAKPQGVLQAPFYAVPFEGGMTTTYGGPKITVKTEVTNLEGKVVPGLYAVGNAAGGLYYKDYLGGSQLGGATVFGRICGREMALRAKAATQA